MIPSGSLRWHLAALLLFGSGAVLCLVAVVSRNPVPLFAALPLLLAPVAAGVQAPVHRVAAALEWSDEGSESDVRLVGQIVPAPGLDGQALRVHFYRPQPLTEAAASEVRVDPGRIRFSLHWSAPYPCLVSVAIPEVTWRDPCGLTSLPVELAGEALRVNRYPPEVARVATVRLRRTTPLPGEIRSRSLGGSGEFFALRPSAPSDTPRQINWRATARAGMRRSNDYSLERTGDLLILLDLRPTSLGPERDQKLLSIGRSAALGIANGFLAEKARVGIGLYDEFLRAVPLGSGRLQRFRIHQALASARVGTVSGPAERLAVSVRRYFPPGVTTLLITALGDDESVHLLPHLRRRGFSTFVLSPSPIPLLLPPASSRTVDDRLAERLLTLVRRQRIQEVWKEAAVVDWTDYWSLARLANFLSSPVRNRSVVP